MGKVQQDCLLRLPRQGFVWSCPQGKGLVQKTSREKTQVYGPCTSPQTMHANFAYPGSSHSKRWKPFVVASSAGARADDAVNI